MHFSDLAEFDGGEGRHRTTMEHCFPPGQRTRTEGSPDAQRTTQASMEGGSRVAAGLVFMGAGKLGPIIAIHGHTAGAHATARDTVPVQPPERMNRAPG
jgi:hypothetical protein